MSNNEAYMELTLVWKGTITPIHVRVDEFHSLMGLISAKLAIPGFGICNGMRSCGTCTVKIRDISTGINTQVLSCAVPLTALLEGKLLSIDGPGL
jgi:aerobic-type carbon monoxide dehydrogenase small subunit (CoxS/CutS family)